MDASAVPWLGWLLGAWQFASTFFWPHTSTQSGNSWTMGMLISAVSLLTLRIPAVRHVNTAVGIWLAVPTFWLPSNWPATRWNDVLVGIAVAALSLVGREPARGTR